METAICQHRDQALLCTIIGEAGSLVRSAGGHVSRRAVMTAFCYCKVAGVPTERRFMIYPPGPVADDILLDLEALEVDEAIKNVSIDPDNHADYVNSVGALSLCARHRTWLETVRPKVTAVLKAMAPLTKTHLAQVACMHFLFLFVRREIGPDDLRAKVLSEFLAAAPGEEWTVTADEADALFSALVEANLIHD